ncbi:MAG TPA: CerR family C-terminal domain-containing protein [Burkholderiaceae bacterium]|jgi:AcrR family transcriptional regulator|nr:CerR family C-terminal domain-containing protein [Burkholderiaceae bacterium]HPE02646.1 CerR family C-terminal domain-containing protein [Burkholderiaceae bacterium]HRZ02224.1 CerR family C-terminal domain-containing protein [Burkholderiaceae bacterium]
MNARPQAAAGGTPIERAALARQELLAAGLRIFAEKGYAAASTREICEAAGVNAAAIHYHFGDKEGLYRAVLEQPIVELAERFAGFDAPELELEEALRRFLGVFLPRADEGEALQLATRLHLREMVEPTAAFRELIERSVRPHHEALVRLIARHVDAPHPDAALHQLALALVAMTHDHCQSRHFIETLAPEVYACADAQSQVLERLVGYGRALVDHERARRDALRSPA